MKGFLRTICTIAFFAAIIPCFLSAKEAILAGDAQGFAYNITVHYNDSPCPGDAVFVRMDFSQTMGQAERERIDLTAATATLELYLGEKRLDKAEFYLINNNKIIDFQNNMTGGNSEDLLAKETFLAGIPLSSWWTRNDGYSLKISYAMEDKKQFHFTLPFNLTNKDFVSETIPLDSRNTGIRTNTSATRMAQIEKLNKVLATTNYEHAFQTTPYTPPTPATRRTSFFADRRVFAYSDGTSATSLHYGIDYGVPTGSTVTACAKGRVVMAEDRISTGWSVVIEHLPGLYSLYYHMSELKVKEGDMVEAGDLIGLSGATGLATGPHLHWEMRLNMSAVNPDFFTGDFTFSAIK